MNQNFKKLKIMAGAAVSSSAFRRAIILQSIRVTVYTVRRIKSHVREFSKQLGIKDETRKE